MRLVVCITGIGDALAVFPEAEVIFERVGICLQDEMLGIDVWLFAEIAIVRVDGNPEMLVKKIAVL